MAVLLKDVKKDLKKFGRDANKYPKYRIAKITSRASEVTKSISYKAIVYGETNNYQVHVQFFKVMYSETPKTGYEKIEVDSSGSNSGKKTTLYYKVPTVRDNPVHLKCSDPDFRFRFEKPLYDQGGLIGNWRRYQRKTPPPPVGYPYANPDNHLGFCKHLWSFFDELKKKKLLKE